MDNQRDSIGCVWFTSWLVAIIVQRLCEGGPYEDITQLVHLTILAIAAVPINLGLGLLGVWGVFWGIWIETWDHWKDSAGKHLLIRILGTLGVFVGWNAMAGFCIFCGWFVFFELGPTYIELWQKVL